MHPKNHLIKLRLYSQLKQSEMANILGITTRHYQSLEAGTSKGSVKVWKQLAELFNTTIDFLLEQEDNKKQTTKTQENFSTCNKTRGKD